MEGKVIGISTALVVVAVVVLGIFAFKEQERWDTWCVEQGGRVDSVTSHGYGWTTGGNGKPAYGPTSTTTRYCLSEDGRIIDMY